MFGKEHDADIEDRINNLESFILKRWKELEKALSAANTIEQKNKLGILRWERKIEKLTNLRNLNKRLYYIVSGADPDNTLVQ